MDEFLNDIVRNMKKVFPVFLLLVFHFSLCSAQDLDTIFCRNGKTVVGKVINVGKDKVVYITPPDSSRTEISTWRIDYIVYPGGTRFSFTERSKTAPPSTASFHLSADVGGSVPSISYRDGIAGFHFGPRGTFYFNHTIGVVAKAEVDFNGTGLDYISNSYWGGFYVFQQYLAGLTYRTGGKPGFPFVDFVGMAGLCKATNPPTTEQGGGADPLVLTNAGSGSGPGFYFGIDFTSSADQPVAFTFGAGFLYAAFSYPDYSTTVSAYDPHTSLIGNTTSDPVAKMSLVLYQMYVGINFRVKKANK